MTRERLADYATLFGAEALPVEPSARHVFFPRHFPPRGAPSGAGRGTAYRAQNAVVFFFVTLGLALAYVICVSLVADLLPLEGDLLFSLQFFLPLGLFLSLNSR